MKRFGLFPHLEEDRQSVLYSETMRRAMDAAAKFGIAYTVLHSAVVDGRLNLLWRTSPGNPGLGVGVINAMDVMQGAVGCEFPITRRAIREFLALPNTRQNGDAAVEIFGAFREDLDNMVRYR